MSIIGGFGSGFGSGFGQGAGIAQQRRSLEADRRFREEAAIADRRFREKQLGLQKEKLRLEGGRLSANVMNMIRKFEAGQKVKKVAEDQQNFENWMSIASNPKMPLALQKEAWQKIAKSQGMPNISFAIENTTEDKLPDFFKGLDALTSMKAVQNERGQILLTKLRPHLERFLNTWRDIGIPRDIAKEKSSEFILQRMKEQKPKDDTSVAQQINLMKYFTPESVSKFNQTGEVTHLIKLPEAEIPENEIRKRMSQISKEIAQLSRDTFEGFDLTGNKQQINEAIVNLKNEYNFLLKLLPKDNLSNNDTLKLPAQIPAGSILQGFYQGNKVYLTPDGRRLMVEK